MLCLGAVHHSLMAVARNSHRWRSGFSKSSSPASSALVMERRGMRYVPFSSCSGSGPARQSNRRC